jgi:hypothetical protein
MPFAQLADEAKGEALQFAVLRLQQADQQL